MPTAAEDGIAAASSHSGSSQAAEHSPIFENGSPAGSSVMLPAATGNGITTAAGAKASSAAAEQSLIFEGSSSADSFGIWSAAAGDEFVNAFSEAADALAFFGRNLSEDTPETLPAAKEEEIATAAGDNTSCQARDHSTVCESDLATTGDSSEASE